MSLRDTTKGELVVEVLHRQVWLWDKSSPTANCWHLIVRREVNSPGTIKYSLSNAPEQTGTIKLAQMQAQRFWIERAFQDAQESYRDSAVSSSKVALLASTHRPGDDGDTRVSGSMTTDDESHETLIPSALS